MEGKIVYIIRRSICIIRASAWVYFFEIKFLRAKIVSKVPTKIISVQMLKMYKNAAI